MTTEAQKFQDWLHKERTEHGLIDIKVCPGNTSQSSRESVFRELNLVVDAIQREQFVDDSQEQL